MLASAHAVVLGALRARAELGELVVVRREHGAAADDVVEMLGAGPRNRESIVGARSTSNLVEHDERSPGRAPKNVRRLLHLHHERALAAGEVVTRADAREHPIDNPNPGPSRWYKGPH